MWRDEVRAFSVATRAPSWPALATSLHQEGHPILWYAILRIGYELTHSHLVLPVASLAIAAVAAFLILRFAPFPFWIRLLMIFGVFLGYEFSVVARNYGIGILLMIAACVAFPARQERPILLAIALALMGQYERSCGVREPHHRIRLADGRVSAGIPPALLRSAQSFRSQSSSGASRSPDDRARLGRHGVLAFSLSKLEPRQLARVLVSDPGQSLRALTPVGHQHRSQRASVEPNRSQPGDSLAHSDRHCDSRRSLELKEKQSVSRRNGIGDIRL